MSSRTFVFTEPPDDDYMPRQVLVTEYDDGRIEVAQRNGGAGSWGPPLRLIHEQRFDGSCTCETIDGAHRFVSP